MVSSSSRRRPKDGDTKACPHCHGTLVFSSRYPVLAVGAAYVPTASHDRIRYEAAWVCRNGGCDYRELVGEST